MWQQPSELLYGGNAYRSTNHFRDHFFIANDSGTILLVDFARFSGTIWRHYVRIARDSGGTAGSCDNGPRSDDQGEDAPISLALAGRDNNSQGPGLFRIKNHYFRFMN
jgi:hypothetical protein